MKIDFSDSTAPTSSCAPSCSSNENTTCCESIYCNIPIQCYVGSISNLTKQFCPPLYQYCQVRISDY